MKDVVILGAGVGSRLRPLTDAIPKLLVEVSGKPILHRALEVLIPSDEVRSVTIVVGYRGDQIEAATKDLSPKIKIVRNHSYEQTNNMHSLYLALATLDMKCDVVIMNGDCVYDPAVLREAINGHGDAIFTDSAYPNNDESMHVDINTNGAICGIAKPMQMKDAPIGTLVVSIDLYRLSVAQLPDFYDIIDNFQSDGARQQWTELALDRLLCAKAKTTTPITATDIDGKMWMEIDNNEDLEKANVRFQGI
jgi:choline kinase